MADPTSDTPMNNSPEDIRPRATIKLKPMTPPTPAADAAPESGAPADAEQAIHISPSPAAAVPGVKQTIRLRPPSAPAADAAEVKPAIKIVPKAAEAPTGIPTAKPVESAANQTIKLSKPESSTPTVQLSKPEASAPTIGLKKAVPSSNPTIQLKKPETSNPTIKLSKPESSTPTVQLKKPESSSNPTIQLKKPESSNPTVQLKKPESSSNPTIQLKKPESSNPTVQLKKPEEAASSEPAKRPGDAPVLSERKVTLKLKNQPSQPRELPKNIIPGLNIPTTPPPIHKDEEQKPEEAAVTQEPQQTTPVAAPVETPTPVPEAVPEDGKKKGKLPKVKKQKAPVTSADEPNWFFLTLSCLTLICVCFIAYLLFAQYMNMYEGMQIPIPEFLMPPK